MSLLPLAFLLFFRGSTFSSASAGNCEVCVRFLHRLYVSLNAANTELSAALVEDELERVCAAAQGKEARLCFYLGASSDAAARVTASVSRPLASHVPADKVCQRLSSSDTQICQLTYEPEVKDVSSEALMKMRVLELRRILSWWGEECRGCLEKHEFVQLIQEKAPLHAHSVDL